MIQGIFPKDLFDAVDKFYEESKSIENMDVSRFHKDVFYKKSEIDIITVKNKALAEKLRKETLEFFR